MCARSGAFLVPWRAVACVVLGDRSSVVPGFASLAELTVVVLDGAHGPGRVLCARLAAAGAVVAIVTVHDGSGALFLSRELMALGWTSLPFRWDPGAASGLADLVGDLAGDLGPVDVVVDLACLEDAAPLPLARTLALAMTGPGRGGRIVQLGMEGQEWRTALVAPRPGLALDVLVLPDTRAVDPDGFERALVARVLALLGLEEQRPARAHPFPVTEATCDRSDL